ncbi:MAG: ferrous iron transport protein B [Thermaceae bacterium]
MRWPHPSLLARSDEARLALVGNPNTGKTSLLNALAGTHLEVGNWPGTTLERVSANLSWRGKRLELVDLPGAYSLFPTSPEEALTQRELLHRPPDWVVNVVDAGNLERNLLLTLEVGELGLPMVLVLNLMDEAKAKGIEVDPDALEEALGVPVLPTVAVRGQGVKEVLEHPPRIPTYSTPYPAPIEEALDRLPVDEIPGKRWTGLALLAGEEVEGIPESVRKQAQEERERLLKQGLDPFLEILEARQKAARALAEKAIRRKSPRLSLSEKVDRFVLHPLLGPIFFLFSLLVVFRFTFALSAPWVDLVGKAQEVLGGWTLALPLPPALRSFLAEGIIAGAGTVLAFTPVLFFLYLALAFLETSGFLARMAFLADRLMQWANLPGRAFIPMVLGFGCNVPAVYTTRSLTHPLERLRVAMAIPFMSCGARLPVYALFSSVFFPKEAPFIVLGLYLLGILAGLLTAIGLGRLLKAPPSEGAMELPPYRFPPANLLLRLALVRTGAFVRGAGGYILGIVLLVWALLHLPVGEMASSLYARLSQALTPLFHPLGLSDWRVVGALIPGFIAKEVVVGTLGLTYLGEGGLLPLGFLEGVKELWAGVRDALFGTLQGILGLLAPPSLDLSIETSPLQEALGKSLTAGAALAYMTFVLLYTPCIATLAAIKEVVGPRWAWASVAYQLLLAYGAALLVKWSAGFWNF